MPRRLPAELRGQADELAAGVVPPVGYGSEPGRSQWVVGFARMPAPAGDGWALPFLRAFGWM